ncbi:hypothetical protein OH76DRAFT_1485986 [Lentinus brumalis]|uniref:Uncharacterized protein n=1 Tax=Lentinus brumalis TaxID=2498619 RepID=A0A371CZX3_9APHY|nr:hypothetical protein OH76DRAFT_1485986 [Polyporus brumalis]
MRVEVDGNVLYVFDSLFKTHRGARRELTWNEFCKAMTSLGCGYEPAASGGSARVFTTPAVFGHIAVHFHEPHGKQRKLDDSIQNQMAHALKYEYGWQDIVFVLKAPAERA